MSHGIGACLLCGSETTERVMALVEWAEPIGKAIWSHVPRCVDRVACRERVERVLAEPWPVNDGTPAPAPLPKAVEVVAVAPNVDEEGPGWLRG